MKAEINIDAILRFLKPESSNQLIKRSLRVFEISKKNRKKIVCLYIISVFIATFVGFSPNTASIVCDTAQTMIDIMLGMFGIVFTGYALFQALMNKQLLIRMLSSDEKNGKDKSKSKLQETNESFVEYMMLNLISIIVSLFLKIIASSIPNKAVIFSKMSTNNIVATLLISLYFYFILIIMWEAKSFIFNVFQVFNMHAGTRVLELLGDDDKDD